MKPKVLICCSLLLAVFAFGAPAWAAKVKICHVPPGNPANFHTITVSENAIQAHLGHGDLLGACFEHCDQLCDDGNACTIDACDAAEQCLLSHPPVSCDDGNLCTNDTCDPAMGCSSLPKVCQDGALCTVDSCDPLTGACVFPPVACDAGEECNATTGSCENEEPTCPCIDQLAGFADVLNGAFGLTSCDISALDEQTFLGSLRTASENPSGVVVQADGMFGIAACALDPVVPGSLLPITVPEARSCVILMAQKAAEAGLRCTENHEE